MRNRNQFESSYGSHAKAARGHGYSRATDARPARQRWSISDQSISCITLFIAVLLASPVQAHNPLQATHFLRQTNQGWILEMNFRDDGLYRAMQQSGLPVAGMSHEELSEATINYVKSGLKLVSTDGFPAEPEVMRWIPDSRSTLLVFRLRNWGAESAPMSVVILAGAENAGHTNILKLDDGRKAFLRAENHFSVDFILKPDGLRSATTPAGILRTHTILFWILLLLLAIGLTPVLLEARSRQIQQVDNG